MTIETRIESKRGCGFRIPGGFYLVSGTFGEACHRLPFELSVCPTCGHGVRQSRSWTWIDGVELFAPGCLPPHGNKHCTSCVICTPSRLIPMDEVVVGEEPPNRGKSGLIWIGEKYYQVPEKFIEEANRMGTSRRITALPRGFVLGTTWVFLAHAKAIFNIKETPIVYKPGIFQTYKPTAIEYVMKGDESEEEIESMIKRGITPVRIEKEGLTREMQ